MKRFAVITACVMIACTSMAAMKITNDDRSNIMEVDASGSLPSKLVNGNGNPVGIDLSTRALETIDYEHHEIHAGSHYNICDYSAAGLASGVVIEFVFTTPDTAEWSHLTFSVFSATGATIELYSGATGITNGTAITVRNNNGNSTNTSGVVVAKDPDGIAADGVRVAGFLAGAGRDAGFAERTKENILTQGSTALVRITSTASQNRIAWCAEWYEHTNKTD
jgi:hypothetical protein